jgi:hypothetical protein
VKLAAPVWLAAGVKVTVPVSSVTVPLTGACTETTLSDWVASLAGPGESFVSRSAAGKVSAVSSAVVFVSAPGIG